MPYIWLGCDSMEAWQIFLCVVINAVWLVPFLLELVVLPIRDYLQSRKSPNYGRPKIKCVTCPHSKNETLWDGRYPNGFPHRHPVYCRLLKRHIRGGKTATCMMKDPPESFYADQHQDRYPVGKIYFSAYGDCYHSTPHCPSIKKSTHICNSTLGLGDRRPCPKCWVSHGDDLYPKS